MTAKLPFIPEQDSYSVDHAVQVVSVKLDGGASRTRADFAGATANVSCGFFLDRVLYQNFMEFWINQTFRGSQKFLVDLVIDFAYPTQYIVTAVPGTFKTSKVGGQTFQVQMVLEAEQVQFFTGSYFFVGPNEIRTPSPVTFSSFLQVGGPVQLCGAGINDGVHPPVNLDGIYVISSFPSGNRIALTSPSAINPDWSLLSSYPSSTTPTISPVSAIGVPS